ncbi:hypothetical protein [Erythrobacter tepidarius]|uniref:hypothetical protein n=1 Tax=Erythrobacter tepidarius TaxID=60454 RepID=UPI00117CD101|nr:hypothetical protein [Erythrobacter tepidarius]
MARSLFGRAAADGTNRLGPVSIHRAEYFFQRIARTPAKLTNRLGPSTENANAIDLHEWHV